MIKRKWLFIPILALLSMFALSACGQDVSVEEGGIAVDEPQGEDEGFRADPVDKVASTGKPQLVEIWASW